MFCVTRITVYVSMCFGEFAGYLCGCNLGLELTISAAAVARGWTSYVATLFRAAPDALRLRIGGGNGDGDGEDENTAVRMMLLDVPAAAIVAGITWMLIRGMKDTARFNTVVTVVSLIVIGFVIVAGGAEVDSNNWYVDCNLILVCARAIRLTYSVLCAGPRSRPTEPKASSPAPPSCSSASWGSIPSRRARRSAPTRGGIYP